MQITQRRTGAWTWPLAVFLALGLAACELDDSGSDGGDGGFDASDGGGDDDSLDGGDDDSLDGGGDDSLDGGDDDKGETLDLIFEGSGFGPHEGQDLWVALIRVDNDNRRASGTSVVSAGDFSFTFPSVLEASKSYRVDYFADVNGDQVCTAGSDHVWSESFGPVTDHVLLQVVHNLNFDPAACDSF